MSQVIHHTTDWSASTLISWGIVTSLCLLYPAGDISLYWQLPIHALILVLLWHSIRKPNEQVRVIAAVYWLSLVALVPLTNTSLVLIHMVMFIALFSVHFSWPIMSGLIGAILGEYLAYYWWLSGSFVWSTVAIWAG
ncbi:MAG: histidine kinase, partial [Pseudomonadota bacterium]